MIQTVAKYAGKFINLFVKAIAKVPLIGKWLSKKIGKYTGKLVTAVAGITSSFVINKILNVLLPNVDLILSLGGAISGLVDWVVDKNLDGKVRLNL